MNERVTHAGYQRDAEETWRLEAAVGEKHAREFSYVTETGKDVWTYQHGPTGRTIHLDADSRFQDLNEDGKTTEVSRAEVQSRYADIPTGLESKPDERQTWERLEKSIGFHGADEFQAYGERGDIQIYMRRVEESKELIGMDSKGRFYEPEPYHQEEPRRISREEALQIVGLQEHYFTPKEQAPTHKDWDRLEQAVGKENFHEFSFKQDGGGIQSYQNERTGSHVHLDSSGQLYDQERQPISRDIALSQALQRPSSETAQTVAQETAKVELPSREQSIGL